MLNDFTSGNRDLVNRMNELMNIARQVEGMVGDNNIRVRHTANGINISLLTPRGCHDGNESDGGTLIRHAIVAEAPLPKPCVKVSLLSSGVPVTSGDEFEVDCYLPFVNADRADMVSPAIALGDVLTVHYTDRGIAIDIEAYDADRSYLINEQCSNSGKVYRSLNSDNLGETITDTDHWEQYDEWDTDTVYAVGNVVEDGALLYICTQATTTSEDVPSAEPGYWDLLERISNPQWCFIQTFAGIKNVSV